MTSLLLLAKTRCKSGFRCTSERIVAVRVIAAINTDLPFLQTDTSMTDAAAAERAEWMARISPMRSDSKALVAFGPVHLQLNGALT